MLNTESRDSFADEIVRTVTSENASAGAFIFGISGHWGEGKTEFLKGLKPKLEKSGIEVVELNPWKYAYEDDSILRELLSQITSVERNPLKRFYHRRTLKRLYQDSSKHIISWPKTILWSAFFLCLVLLYHNPPHSFMGIKKAISGNKTAVTLLLIPIFLGVAKSVTISQLSSKAVSTKNEFDQILNSIIGGTKKGKKIAVYVDDLDRLTAKKAVLVLDNLRTFFDNERLIFVVASDHTVLERHLGNELKPSSDLPEQIEEGRRFLKKIFNVYWRLPLPTKPEFKDYIKSQLIGTSLESFIYAALLNEASREQFHEYLARYFSNNFRNAERFVHRVEFTLRLIRAQNEKGSTPDENKKYFGEMLNNPLLVVRILLIEELANPVFERILHNPEILLKLEQEAGSGVIDEAIRRETNYGNKESIISSEQFDFLKSFLPLKPRFRDETGDKVQSIEPYIFLSSDSSFGDIRGLSPEDFVKYLMNDSIPELVDITSRSSEQKLKDSVQQFISHFQSSNLEDQKKLLSNLISTTTKTDPSLSARQILTSGIVDVDLSMIDQLPPQEKVQMIEMLGKLSLDEDQMTQIITKAPNFNDNDYSQLSSLVEISPLGQVKFLLYFKSYFASNPSDSITRLGPYLEKFESEIPNTNLSDLQSALISNFIADNNDARREYLLAILAKINNGLEALKTRLRQEIKNKNRPIFNWLATQTRASSEPFFSVSDIVYAVFELDQESSVSDVIERIGLFESLPEAKEVLWKELMKIDEGLLFPSLYETSTIANYAPISPTNETSNALLDKLIKKLIRKESVDAPESVNWLIRINRNSWLFSNLHLNAQSKRLISDKLRNTYLTDHARSQLQRILQELA